MTESGGAAAGRDSAAFFAAAFSLTGAEYAQLHAGNLSPVVTTPSADAGPILARLYRPAKSTGPTAPWCATANLRHR